MKLFRTTSRRNAFEPLFSSRKLQAAMMTLSGGASSDEEVANEHPRSEQWMYVISGSGKAVTISASGNRKTTALRRGMLLVIEQAERHKITNTGRAKLRTINFYAPPAYRSGGELKS